MNKKKRILILKQLEKNNHKYKKNSLKYHSPFELLISVMLSAQCTDIRVNKITNRLYKIANTPEKFLSLGINKIRYLIKSIGLFNKKAKNIIEISKILIKYHNSQIPNNRKELESLPGVGRKTANIILNTIFNFPTIAVDTHVFRFCKRTKFVTGNNVLEIEKKLIQKVPTKYKKNCHYFFLNHARYICTAKNPKCQSCIINKLCEFKKKKTNIHLFLK
ncbi:MAG: endonuclease III [Arsenophonus sp.]|nr:MAG: endonuclease III [Arsenophonus sp.]